MRNHPLPCFRPRAPGFTLLELLVVVAIVAVLMGMLMPMITQAKRSSLRTVTQGIMSKAETALYQYKSDYRGYPYLDVSDGQPWTNTLAYNVGTDIAPADAASVKADMDSAGNDYLYDLTWWVNGWGPPHTGGVHTFIDNRNNGFPAGDQVGFPESDVAPWYPAEANNGTWYWVYSSTWSTVAPCVMLNRLGAERARELLLIGDIKAGGCVMQPIAGPGGLFHHGRDLSGTPLVASPASAAKPGWASDYLAGDVESKYIQGSALLDAYLHPLIYICQVQPGIEQCSGQIYGNSIDINVPWYYGLQPIGRHTLQPYNNGTTNPIAGDPTTLPDSSNLMHSDMRAWAPPGYELEFELWSAGPDGYTSWWRDDPANRDNIPCEPYNKGIGKMP